MVTTMRTMQRINNCRDMLNKAICPRMRLMWKRNYEFLLNTYVEDINGRRISAAREVH
jgi:hypothetical protein